MRPETSKLWIFCETTKFPLYQLIICLLQVVASPRFIANFVHFCFHFITKPYIYKNKTKCFLVMLRRGA